MDKDTRIIYELKRQVSAEKARVTCRKADIQQYLEDIRRLKADNKEAEKYIDDINRLIDVEEE